MGETEKQDGGCPECGKNEGFDPMGSYRAICRACGALLKNEEVVDAS